MSLSAVYLQHRMQLLERHISTLVQMMKLRHPGEADDLADLDRVWPGIGCFGSAAMSLS